MTVTKICVESGSPVEGANLRYVMNLDRQMKGGFDEYDHPGSPNEGAWLS